MEYKFAERLIAVLREEGFEIVEEHSVDHAFTASARSGDVRVVIHAADREFHPAAALPRATAIPASEVFMRAGLPAGVVGAVQLGPGVTGAGGEAGGRGPRKAATKG